ncbi:MAG: Fe-S cluster assembly protein SufD [Lentimicrobiaceae bacterium]|jgi:Fe-S cluster assembly protein SufD|nr:Fe-S cluster assembly protein SufD [Lentimicrobiaceae bacterium]MCP4909934.1 Fe-S cluster assembly protein SufD [Bacteroidota bacterium]MBT3454927.1 Fe-S cluster assembly protein SufD [Lentimicrobiaceae bacterium]MBT3818447.1 Fe-S cluster assembly protein SufD [Lentimicrobiaceae bacterium]MBT4060815.1 Fe-S cluster assembly protein SufD [Lentimicrobiaceae bacterium]
MKSTDNKKFPLEVSLIDRYKENPEDVFKTSHQKVKKSREKGFESFNNLGLPTTKKEQWRSTNLSKSYNTDFVIGDNKPDFDKEINEIFDCTIHGFSTDVYALLNGWYYSPDNEKLEVLDDGIIVGSIIKAQEEYPELFDEYYDETSQNNNHGLKAINSAIYTDGLFLYVPDNIESERTIQLVKMVNRESNIMVNTRNLIILGKNSKLSFLHCDDSINQHTGFLNTNTEIFIGENASLILYKLQNINNQTSLINSTTIKQKSDSNLNVILLSFNGGTLRNEFHIDLTGECANADISAMYLMDNEQHVDNQVKVMHSAPNCTSSELFKGVLDDEASAVFNGYIYVARDSQKTVAFQKNANILMTTDATIDTMPFLEIYADDVKCSHGATVGQIDNDALFYLMQRGIPEKDAKLLLIYAFIAEVTSKIDILPLRISIDDMVKKRLRGDLYICDKCVLHCSKPEKLVEFDLDMSKI